jgi:hypothetical protein
MWFRPAIVSLTATAALVAGCGGGSSSSSSGPASTSGAQASGPSSSQPANPDAPEFSPAGDIPDDQAFVRYAPPGAGFSVTVPEGWARSRTGAATTFSDKLNSIRLESRRTAGPLTIARARSADLPSLAKTTKGFRATGVTAVARPAGTAVRETYQASGPQNAVTGKVQRNAVERYVFFRNGREAILTLSGPVGADNVDPWRIVTSSVKWAR